MVVRENVAPGKGVDAAGGPVVDPSLNVKDLSDVTNRRQDDLRAVSERLVDAKIAHLREVGEVRAHCTEELTIAESKRVDAEAKLRAEYNDKLSLAEAKRIDAIRAVDVNAVAVASQRSAEQATVLAAQVQQSAEALRGLVASTALTNAQAQQTANATLSTRITTLEQAQYEGKGKTSVSDPATAEALGRMAAAITSLSQKEAQTTGRGVGRTEIIAWIIGGIGAAFLIFDKLIK